MGVPWPEPRFVRCDETVTDHLTGLMWTRDANRAGFPLMWEETIGYIRGLNTSQTYGYSDWRLPNRRELFSLIGHVHINPALPFEHPFVNVFPGYYWTSTTCIRLTSQAWYLHLGGGRVFKGMKHGSYMVWPVRGGHGDLLYLPRTGQKTCFDKSGAVTPCADTGQDADFRMGAVWPEIRFARREDTVADHLTGLTWTRNADLADTVVTWQSALKVIHKMNAGKAYGYRDWRLPNIRELESLTDMGSHTPALPAGHPFEGVGEGYWSSTTSTYDPRYAWVLYMVDGSIGVGYKPGRTFLIWAVRSTQ